MPTLEVTAGIHPIALRQEVLKANDFLGAAHKLASVPFVPNAFSGGIFTYGPATGAVATAGDAGGVFDTPTNGIITLREINLECGAGSVVDVIVTDANGDHPRKILTGVDGTIHHTLTLTSRPIILPNEIIIVDETTPGTTAALINKFVTLYMVDGRYL